MPVNFKKEDLRIIKTYKALTKAMITLLKTRNFGKITVYDLCEEALVSRATFYAHFNDKYDLLKHWLTTTKEVISKDVDDFAGVEAAVNSFVYENEKIIKNIVNNTDCEMQTLLHEFVFTIIDSCVGAADDARNENREVLYNFCAGGMVNHLTSLINKNPPSNVRLVSRYYYDLLKCIFDWDMAVSSKSKED